MVAPASRVFALLELLQSRGQMDGATLARELAVDRRTVRRQIAALEELGIPVRSERGRYGGYRLEPGFRLPPLMFSEDEALALGLGLLAARQLGLTEAAPAVASAQAKLERVLPPALKQRQRGIAERVALDLSAPPSGADSTALATLGAAALAQQRVRLRYADAHDVVTERPFDPYGLGYRGGRWYAVGHCGLRQALRSFRLDRIALVEPLPQSFGRPADFDVLSYLSRSLVSMPRAFAVRALVRAPWEALIRQPLASLSSLEQQPEGILLSCQADELPWMAHAFAALPFDFTILAPDALNDELRALGQRLSRL